tara:strand:+ start:283 stop:2004 length:1722 start_codon:yes stop_codon:yes gene_type:complete
VKLFVIILLFLNVIFPQTVNVSVDKQIMQEGDVLQLMIEVSGARDFPKIEMDKIKKNFEFVGGPYEKTSIEVINGKMKDTKTLTWTLSPRKTGYITIPEIQGLIDGKKFVSKPIKISVVNNLKKGSENSVFILAEVDKETAYLGEQITLTYKLYVDVNTKISGIDQFQMPDFNGFWVEEIFTPQRLQYQNKNVLFQGRKYQVANLGQRALFPIAADKHIIPAVSVKTQIEKKNRNKRRDPFFDPFFNSFFTETQTKIIKSKKRNITIKSFPEPKPTDFSGAVGDFKINVAIDQKEVEVNDGIIFTIILEGTGNLGLFTLPKVEFHQDLEAFPPNDDYKKDVFRNQITGSQKLEYVLIPRKPGHFEIPMIEMSFFNLKLDSWSSIKTDSIKIKVTGNNFESDNLTGLTKKEIELLSEDIRFIKTNSSEMNTIENKLSTVKYLFYFLSAIIFFLPVFSKKIMKTNLFRVDDRRKKNAIKKSLKILKTKNPDSFNIASKAIYTYIQERLLLSSKNLDPNTAKSLLRNYVDDVTLKELINILKICDAGKYSPTYKEELHTIIPKTKNILKNIDKVFR